MRALVLLLALAAPLTSHAARVDRGAPGMHVLVHMIGTWSGTEMLGTDCADIRASPTWFRICAGHEKKHSARSA